MFFKKNIRLLTIENCVKKILSAATPEKDYAYLQSLEEVLRKNLLNTLEVKSKVAESLVAKDVELNKELLARIKEQPKTQHQPLTHPRFKDN